METPTDEQARIVKVLTESDILPLHNIAEHTGLKMHVCQSILEEMIGMGYAAALDDDEYTLTR